MLSVCMYMHIHNVNMSYESQLPSVWHACIQLLYLMVHRV